MSEAEERARSERASPERARSERASPERAAADDSVAPALWAPGTGRRLALTVVVSVAVVALLVRTLTGAPELFAAFADVRWSGIALAALLVAVNVVLAAVRWSIVLRAMDYPVPLRRALYAVIATWPLSALLPSRAGDFFRSLYVRDRAPVLAGVGSVLAEKMVDAQNLGLLALVGCLRFGFFELAGLAGGALLALAALVTAMLVSKERVKTLPLLRKKPERIDQMVAALSALRRRPGHYVALTGFSLLSWLNVSLIVTVLMWSYRAPIPYSATVALFPFATFAGMMPLTFAGFGTRDAAFLFALQTMGFDVAEASSLAATLSYAVLGSFAPALVGLPFLAFGRPPPPGRAL